MQAPVSTWGLIGESFIRSSLSIPYSPDSPQPRCMGWHERIVYHRDFALDARRSRMANGSIGHLPAGTFAEYVVDRVRVETKWQRDRLLSGPTVDVYVGPAQRHWALHRNLLCHHSERLNDELQAGQAATLYLADYDPAGFKLLVTWLYQGRLDNVSDKADAAQKYDYAVACHKLYLLCHRLAMLPLSNLAIHQYRNALHQAQLVPDPDEINDIYRTSPAASSPFPPPRHAHRRPPNHGSQRRPRRRRR